MSQTSCQIEFRELESDSRTGLAGWIPWGLGFPACYSVDTMILCFQPCLSLSLPSSFSFSLLASLWWKEKKKNTTTHSSPKRVRWKADKTLTLEFLRKTIKEIKWREQATVYSAIINLAFGPQGSTHSHTRSAVSPTFGKNGLGAFHHKGKTYNDRVLNGPSCGASIPPMLSAR